jgi:hypothetical protein
MSFPDVLDAARALPRDEQLKLANALLEGAECLTPNTYDTPEHLRHLFPPPGAAFEVFTPFDCFEAAAVLERMLAERKGQ